MTNGVPVEEIKEGTKEKVPRNARQLWTDDQLAKLARLMNKYPGGTQDRWETIAEAMERYPWEITKMAANVKSSMHMVILKNTNSNGFRQIKEFRVRLFLIF